MADVALGTVCEVFRFGKLNRHHIDASNYVVKENALFNTVICKKC